MYMTPEEIREKFPDAFIERDVQIGRYVLIGSDARIGSGAVIKSGAVIGSGTVIGRGAAIGRNRKGVTRTLVINGIGTTKQMTAHTSDDGLVVVIGCLNDYRGATIEQARKAIADKYPPEHAYFLALDLAQRWYDQIKKEQEAS